MGRTTRQAARIRGVFLSLDPRSRIALHRQIYGGVREAIVKGTLRRGERLASTRAFAQQLRVSRNTVLAAIEQLIAEGFLETRLGSGTYVTQTLPEYLSTPLRRVTARSQRTADCHISVRGSALAAFGTHAPAGGARTFRPGVPDLDAFPRQLWARLAARTWRRASAQILGYADPAGYGPLRAAIARYLVDARGVQCQPDQVIVVAGSQQALHVAAHVLLDEGDSAWVEDPGYPGARAALLSAGADVVPISVDREGLTLNPRRLRSNPPRLIYVSPSHQFPLGVTMTLTRRLQLLHEADACGAWIVEDDYDSEYRYASRPIAALQGLGDGAQVVYVGTFSKVLAPCLRLGYLVVPATLVEKFASARSLIDRESPTVDQAVLADFIDEGHFERHITRMRRVYASRRNALVESAQHHLGGLLELEPGDAGLHVLGWLPQGVDDREAAGHAAVHGVAVMPLSAFCSRSLPRGGLILSYGASNVEAIHEVMPRLARALHEVAGRRDSSKRR